ncbi:MAG: GTP-binding protein EngA, partial [uncultured Gemmatimonadetes bacterium]
GQVHLFQPRHRRAGGDRGRPAGGDPRPQLLPHGLERAAVLPGGHRGDGGGLRRAHGPPDPRPGAHRHRRGRRAGAGGGRQDRRPPPGLRHRRDPAQDAEARHPPRQQGGQPGQPQRRGAPRLLGPGAGRAAAHVVAQRQGERRHPGRHGRPPARGGGRGGGGAAGGRHRQAQRGEVVLRQPPAGGRAAGGERRGGHHPRRHRHAHAVPRAHHDLRGHRGAAAPEQDRRRGGVLLLHPHRARHRPGGRLRADDRRHRAHRRAGPEDRGEGVGGGVRAGAGRQQVGPGGEGDAERAQLREGDPQPRALPEVGSHPLHQHGDGAARVQDAGPDPRRAGAADAAHRHARGQRGAARADHEGQAAPPPRAPGQVPVRHAGVRGAAHHGALGQPPGRGDGKLRALPAERLPRRVGLQRRPHPHQPPPARGGGGV